MEGRVLRTTGLQCLVLAQGDTWLCQLRGRLKFGQQRTNAPLVAGDLVQIAQTEAGKGVVEQVHPRGSKISRVASGSKPFEQVLVANIDRFIVIVAVKNPKVRPGFIDRALIVAMKNGIHPVLCFNKMDLGLSYSVEGIAQLYKTLGYQVIFTSTQTDDGLDELKDVLSGRVSALVGQSGVGKSSLINCIDPSLKLKTQTMMQKHDRGRHTTTVVQLHMLMAGGFVADTPGLKELEPWGMELGDLDQFFKEMQPFSEECRFRNCRHLDEPGCAVLTAVDEGIITAVRFGSYQRFREELMQKGSHERTIH
jgi:ribosome biogenesis GTPase